MTRTFGARNNCISDGRLSYPLSVREWCAHCEITKHRPETQTLCKTKVKYYLFLLISLHFDVKVFFWNIQYGYPIKHGDMYGTHYVQTLHMSTRA